MEKDEGQAKADLEADSNLERFLTYIRLRKVVLLDDVASEFCLKTKEVIERVKDLEKMGRLMGVFDDRGKFIVVTDEELTNLSNYLKGRGRVSKSDDLVPACNRLIRMDPTQEDKELIIQEERAAIAVLEAHYSANEERIQSDVQ